MAVWDPHLPGTDMTTLEVAGRSRSVAVLLTLSGGFLDAFTYVGHGGVFANAMSGNVALLGIHIASGDWTQAGRHVPPLIAFALSVCVVHLLGLTPVNRFVRRPALAWLLLEIGFLALAASDVIRLADLWLIPGITFVATLQTLSFTHVGNLTYTSVMTTGNLRRATKMLLEGLIPRYDKAALHDASLLGMAGFCFLAGAVLGIHDRSGKRQSTLDCGTPVCLRACANVAGSTQREHPAVCGEQWFETRTRAHLCTLSPMELSQGEIFGGDFSGRPQYATRRPWIRLFALPKTHIEVVSKAVCPFCLLTRRDRP
jgi:uncharacterized membrane protein YoaK (UPF0700 family)